MSLTAQTLSATAAYAEQGRLPDSLDCLRSGLFRARASMPSPEAWRDEVDRHVRHHPILGVAHENPLVERCFQKPRGYAGDAVMLDFIYRHPANGPLLERTTPRGRQLLQATLTTPAARAVRNRCRLLADEIDALCFRNPKAEILSLACGHLREAEYSAALAEGRFGRFVALDQDPESVATVQRDCRRVGVDAREGSVRSIMSRGLRGHGRFDFIYAAGLYDYLQDRVAQRLLAAFFEMLKPGGKVWVANFVPGIADVGFMEAIMDWWLIYRDTPGMAALGSAALGSYSNVASMRAFQETEGNIAFLEAVKA